MVVYNIFSERQKLANGEMPDVFIYDKLPDPLKNQIVHILSDAVGLDSCQGKYNICFTRIRDILLREHGLLRLTKYSRDPKQEVLDYFLQLAETNKAIDVVEVALHIINLSSG